MNEGMKNSYESHVREKSYNLVPVKKSDIKKYATRMSDNFGFVNSAPKLKVRSKNFLPESPHCPGSRGGGAWPQLSITGGFSESSHSV